MHAYDYRLLDVFTTRAFEGNPLAVFLDGRGLDDGLMQRIARELNLSETVFVLPPTREGPSARLRIFTPTRELPFAGHPTVGAASALLDAGAVSGDRFMLEEPVGDVRIRVERSERAKPIVWLTSPPVIFGDTVDRDAVARALHVECDDLHAVQPQYVSAGSPFLVVALRSMEAVDRARYERRHLPAPAWPNVVGIFVFATQSRAIDGFPAVYARMFAPESGIAEDPATGGATGPLAAYLARNELLSQTASRRFVSEQGTKMGRRSLLHVARSAGGDTIEIGGSAIQIGRGTLTL